MSPIGRIPVIDFSFDGEDDDDDGAPTANLTASKTSLNDFRAVYDMMQCVCFKSQKRQNNRHSRPRYDVQGIFQDGQDTRVDFSDKRQESHASPTMNNSPRKRKRKRTPSSSVLDLIRETYNSAASNDKESWNVENSGDNNKSSNTGNNTTTMSPSDFLQTSTTTNANAKNGYCSFVLQDNFNRAITNFAKRMEEEYILGRRSDNSSRKRAQLPYSLLINEDNETNYKTTGPTTKDDTAEQQMQLSPHYWIFVGRNNNENATSLTGRKEHTDNISHNGTVHYQVRGSKIWKLRPTAELVRRCDEDHDVALVVETETANANSSDANYSKYYYEVLVEEGDFLVINTRLWWHQTLIPSGNNEDDRDNGLSVSIARDVYFEDHDESSSTLTAGVDHYPDWKEHHDGDGSGTEKDKQEQECMTNVEASWASGFIPKGTILLVDQTIDATNSDDEEENWDNNNDDSDIASLYQHLLPSTIRRTTIKYKFNCQLVLQGKGEYEEDVDCNQGGKSKGDTGSDKNRKQRELALETTRDIQEGEEFVVFVGCEA